MKKTLTYLLLMFLTLIPISQVFNAESETTTQTNTLTYTSYEDYYFGGATCYYEFYFDESLFPKPIVDGKKGESEIEVNIREEFYDILNKLDYYSNNSGDFDTNGKKNYTLGNLYAINTHPNQWVETDKVLYDQLLLAQEYKELTNGSFDYTVGMLINLWKDLLMRYAFMEVPDVTFFETVQKASDIMKDFPLNPIEFKIEDSKYYIKIANDKVSLDLGAFTKGYAALKLKEVIESYGITYFLINFGTSSLYYGKNYKSLISDNNIDDDEFTSRPESYLIYVRDPLASPFDLVEPFAAVLGPKDVAFSTSGDQVQFFMHKGVRYSHIISPLDYMPVSYYHQISVLGDNPAALDAISTAFYSLPIEDMKEIVDALDLSVLIYCSDGTIDERYIDTIKYLVSINPNRLEVTPILDKGTATKQDYLVPIFIIIVSVVLVVLSVLIYRQSKTKRKETLLVALFIIIVAGVGLSIWLWPKVSKNKALIYYQTQGVNLVSVDFSKKTVTILEVQDVNPELNPDGVSYPYVNILDPDISDIYLLGDFKVDGKMSIFVVRVDFKKGNVKVIEESSPYHLVSNMGESSNVPLISLPNKIYIRFGDE